MSHDADDFHDKTVEPPPTAPGGGQRLNRDPEDSSKPTTPPPDVQTDPDRGVGEMGTEELDPSQPLPKKNEPG